MTKEKFLNKIKENKSFLITVAICLLIMFLCSFSQIIFNFWVNKDDLVFHAARIGGIAEAILSGQFPIKYYSSWIYGGGYFGSIFYGDFFLIFPALLVVCGLPLKVSYTIFTYTIYILFFVCMYFFSKKYLKSKNLSAICAGIFCISQYVFSNFFRRGAVGEIIAIIFVFVFLLAIYNMLNENYSKPWLFSVAFMGLLLSHMTLLIVCAIVLVGVVIFNCKKLFNNKKFWIKSLFALGIFVLVGLYSLSSFVELYFSDTYKISQPWTYPSENVHNLYDMLGNSKYAIGFLLLSAFVLRFFIKKTEENKEEIKIADNFLILSGIILFFVSSLFPWQLFDKIFSFLQFPWRLNTFAAIYLSITLVLLLKNLKSINTLKVKIICSCVVFAAVVYNNLYVSRLYSSTKEFNYSTNICFEWTPMGIDLELLKQKQVVNENGDAVEYNRKENSVDIDFSVSEDSNYYITPLIYYKGYDAYLIDENGKKTDVDVNKDSETGLVKVETNGEVGKVYLYYAGTTIQNVTFPISFGASCLFIIGGIVYFIVKKKKQKN
ncbi:MAG: hypothetical protein IJW32_03405 [Clostridia bacterium]|nr:hypothetical protein [Clostridia bacterium]